MRKFKSLISTLLAIVLAAATLTFSPSAASALGLPTTITARVGDIYYHDLSPAGCEGETGPITYSIDGTLPPGIGLNPNSGVIAGIFTQEGTYPMAGTTNCFFPGPNGHPTGASYPTNATFIVLPEPAEVTPVPSLAVEALGGPNCDIEVTGTFPEEQDSGTAMLYLTSENGSLAITLVEQAANTPFTLTYSVNNPSLSGNPLVAESTTEGEIRCSTDVDVELGYRFRTAPYAFAEVLATYATFDLPTAPHIAVSNIGDNLCGLYLSGRFPTSGDRGTKPMVTVVGESGEISVIPAVNNRGEFFVWVPLDDLGEFNFYNGSLVLNGPAPECGEMLLIGASLWVEGQEQNSGTMYSPSRYCDPGYFDNGEACLPAPAGSYVSGFGMNESILCPKGTFQEFTGANECMEAPIGTYVATKGAVLPVDCPSGKVTAEEGATHVSECYSLKKQTFKILKTTSKMKFGASILVPSVSDNLVPLTVQTIGNCTQSDTTMSVKIGKTRRTVAAVRITATSEAGQCSVRFNSDGDSYYRGFIKDMVIKVSRTGK